MPIAAPWASDPLPALARRRAAEAAFGVGKREGGEVPWLWIGAGVLAVILIARR